MVALKSSSSTSRIRLGQEVRCAIDKITLENETLKQELARESRQSRLTQVMNSNQGGDVQRLQLDADGYLRKIEVEKSKIELLDGKISASQRTIVEQRRRMGGANASKENHDLITKQIRILENRLDKALQKFNESLASNKQLRDQIDNLRRERVVFDGIYKKLERELHEKKREMAAIIEDSKHAYHKSDKAQSEMTQLRQQVDREKEDFEREWRALGKLMERDRFLREAVRRKMRDDQLASSALVTSGAGDLAPFEADAGLGEQRASLSHDKLPLQLSHDQVASYEETFSKIREATGVDSIPRLIENFQEIEQKNFSLFNSINELNSDIEQSELTIAETKLEIEKYKGQGVSTDTQRKKVLRDLEERLARTTAAADEYDLKHQSATKTINQLKTGIHSIFSRLGCASTSVEEMLGNQGVTESNMMQYLEIIESRTTEILQQYALSQQAATSHANAAGGGSAPSQSSLADDFNALQQGIVQPAALRLSVQPPAWDDFSSGDDSDQEDDERPLTREELQRKTLRGLGMKDKHQHHHHHQHRPNKKQPNNNNAK